MATVADCKELKETECAVCHGDFTDPKILPCAHLLCRDCLVTCLQSDDTNQCPVCLCAIVDPATLASKSCEELADGLLTDLAMAVLVDSVRILRQHKVCSACNNVVATSFCPTCCDMLCRSCGRVHAKLSVSRHHQVHSLTSPTQAQLAASRPASCSAHQDRPPELYCPEHGISICVLCASTEHQACPDLTKMDTLVNLSKAVIGQIASLLSDGAQDLERIISQLDQQLAHIDHVTQTTMADIDVTYNRLETFLQAWRQRQQQLVKGANSQAKTAVHGGKAVLLERLSKVTSHLCLAERTKQATPAYSMATMTSTVRAQISSLNLSATLPEDVSQVMPTELTFHPEALEGIEQELADLGHLRNCEDPSISPIPQTVPTLKIPEFRFHDTKGKNIALRDNNTTAERYREYLDSLVFSSQPLLFNVLYQVEVVKIDEVGMVRRVFFTGVTMVDPASLNPPPDHVALLKSAFSIYSDCVNLPDRKKVKTNIGHALWNVPVRGRVGLLVDSCGRLHLYRDGKDLGVAVTGVTEPCYAFFDVLHECRKIKALPPTYVNPLTPAPGCTGKKDG